MTGYGYEVDFLPVGSGDKSGDAIVLRYGEAGSYKVIRLLEQQGFRLSPCNQSRKYLASAVHPPLEL